MKTIYLAMIAVCLLASGCAGLTQTLGAKMESDEIAVKAADDLKIKLTIDAICLMPFGAIVRNTGFIPVAKAACLPAGSASNAVTLFDGANGAQVQYIVVPPSSAPVSTTAVTPIAAPTPAK